MPKEMKALAVDANILISLFLGKKLKQLVIDNLENLKNIEIKDWPTLALALKLGCPVWTDDKDFFGVGVPVWSSQTIGHYLKVSCQDRTE